MALIKSKDEILILREGGRRLAAILGKLIDFSRAGVSTLELDRIAEKLILEAGGTPSFKGYRIEEAIKPYPASICASLNDEVVHSIPREDKILKSGDILGIDIGMKWPAAGGFYTDMAVTIGIGALKEDAAELLRVTEESLRAGIKEVRPGARTGDIGHAVQKILQRNEYGIVRSLAGHGVGHAVHEEPLIPNYGKKHTGVELKEGMVIAIEPMATMGEWRVVLDEDGWTFRTADGSLAAHFEHTVAVTRDGAEILTVIE